jgi:hypothetical protein
MVIREERIRIALLFIYRKSSSLYRMEQHASLGNIQRVIEVVRSEDPIRYNTYEKIIHRERKVLVQGKDENICYAQKRKKANTYESIVERKENTE